MSLSPYPPPNAPSGPPGRRQPPLTPTPVAAITCPGPAELHFGWQRFGDDQETRAGGLRSAAGSGIPALTRHDVPSNLESHRASYSELAASSSIDSMTSSAPCGFSSAAISGVMFPERPERLERRSPTCRPRSREVVGKR